MAHVDDEGIGKKKIGIAPPNINVTPLIDVLLVLIIIFMVIQPRREAQFESNIPQKPDLSDPNIVPPSDLLMVEVDLSGNGPDQNVKLNSKSMPLIELGNTLKTLLEQRPDKTVFLKGPRDKQYGD